MVADFVVGLVARLLWEFSLVMVKAVALSFVIFGLILAGLFLPNYAYHYLTPIAADLPADGGRAAAEFDRRVRERFLRGSPEAELIAELERQGFVRSWNEFPAQILQDSNVPAADWDRASRAGGAMSQRPRIDFDPICSGERRVVFWQADATGKIIAAAGKISSWPCL